MRTIYRPGLSIFLLCILMLMMTSCGTQTTSASTSADEAVLSALTEGDNNDNASMLDPAGAVASTSIAETDSGETGVFVESDWAYRDSVSELDISIETPYGVLFYPGEYAEYMDISTEYREEDNLYTVVFTGSINGHTEYLFSICIGTISSDAISLGTVTDGNGITWDVGLEIADFVPDSSWSNTDAEMMCSMQEAMNYVIQNMTSISSFVPA